MKVMDIWVQDEAICWLCGDYVPLSEASRDHVVPRSLGGRTKVVNIRLAHKSCNSRRGSKDPDVFKKQLAAEEHKRDKEKARKERESLRASFYAWYWYRDVRLPIYSHHPLLLNLTPCECCIAPEHDFF